MGPAAEIPGTSVSTWPVWCPTCRKALCSWRIWSCTPPQLVIL